MGEKGKTKNEKVEMGQDIYTWSTRESKREISGLFPSQARGGEGCSVQAPSRNNSVLTSVASVQVLAHTDFVRESHTPETLLE